MTCLEYLCADFPPLREPRLQRLRSSGSSIDLPLWSYQCSVAGQSSAMVDSLYRRRRNRLADSRSRFGILPTTSSRAVLAPRGRRPAAASSLFLLVGILFSAGPFSSFSSSASLAQAYSGAVAAIMPRNIVVIGGGIQGASVAFHLAEESAAKNELRGNEENEPLRITVLEAKGPASAASGKGGGFMARSWGDGSPTQQLHELAFDLYGELAPRLGCESYRKLPVLSVAPGSDSKGLQTARRDSTLSPLLPGWLDGSAGRIRPLGVGDDTAQITPAEFVQKMLERRADCIQVVLGTCTGVETVLDDPDDNDNNDSERRVVGVHYTDAATGESGTLPADAAIVAAGPWSCAAEEWFPDSGLRLPMEGVKSTSIVWEKPVALEAVDATALFCGEDRRYGTHLEVYPRPDGTIYICGIGGSDYISADQLKLGAFRDQCDANPSRVDAASAAFRQLSTMYENNGRVAVTQACMRPCPPDALPYMGKIPGYSGAYINAGHNCWGIAWAPATGKAMAELILHGRSECVDLDPFDPARFTPTADRGTRGRKRRGENVGEQW